MLRNIILAAALITGCTTTSHLTEPDRSELFVSCLSNGVTATVCECTEEFAVKETGFNYVTNLSQQDQGKFVAALATGYEQCKADGTTEQPAAPAEPAHLRFDGRFNRN